MTRRPFVRLTLLVGLVLSLGAAAHQITLLERARAAEQARVEAVVGTVATAIEALADVRASERAFLAESQGADYWRSRLDGAVGRLTRSVDALRAEAARSVARLDTTGETLAQLVKLEARIADHALAGRLRHAEDLIFADALEASGGLERDLRAAAPLLAAESHARIHDLREREIVVAVLAAAVALLVTVLLVPVPLPAAGRQTADVPQEQADLPLNLRGAATPREAASTAVPAPAAPLAASAAAHGREPGPGPDLTSVSRLPAAADLCAALARVQRSRDLPALLSHVCRVLDAQGIIVWLADPDQQSLAPALHYGYRPEALERLGNVPSDARNPTADAFRRQEPRVIDGGAGGQGAVVIPLISANGCAGVVTVELRHGVVPDSSIVSLARIFVAQLAGFVAPAAVAEPTVEVASRKLEVGS